MNRTQIYLDDDQTDRLDQRAAAEGKSRSMLIRQAVDVYLLQEDRDTAAWKSQWKEAIKVTAGIASYLDEGIGYVDELRSNDADRLSGKEG